MLPPQHGEIKNSLLISQFAMLKDRISEVIVSELGPLRALIECSAKDIDLRLHKLEDRLQSAVGANSSQETAQAACIDENKNKRRVSIDKDSKKNMDVELIGIV